MGVLTLLVFAVLTFISVDLQQHAGTCHWTRTAIVWPVRTTLTAARWLGALLFTYTALVVVGVSVVLLVFYLVLSTIYGKLEALETDLRYCQRDCRHTEVEVARIDRWTRDATTRINNHYTRITKLRTDADTLQNVQQAHTLQIADVENVIRELPRRSARLAAASSSEKGGGAAAVAAVSK